jgi:hypothetical protein
VRAHCRLGDSALVLILNGHLLVPLTALVGHGDWLEQFSRGGGFKSVVNAFKVAVAPVDLE